MRLCKHSRPARLNAFCRRMPVSTYVCVVAAMALSACDMAARERHARIKAACGAVELDYSAIFHAALGGDVAAIDCEITLSDIYGIEMDYDFPGKGDDSVAWRYLRWIETGEQPERLMEIAARTNRDDAIRTTGLFYIQYLEAAGETFTSRDRYDENGCFIRPPRMDEIWRAGQPGELGELCADAVRDHPSH
jgi:hypothetical protein